MKKSFSQLFTEARNSGKGLFEYNGKLYSTLKRGEDEDTFRRQHTDYDDFMGNLGNTISNFYNHNDSTYGGWTISNPTEVSYKVNHIPETTTVITDSVVTEDLPKELKLRMFTNDDIRNLGFKNYSGLVSAASDPNNAGNSFVLALITRFGNPNTWKQSTVENALGVKGEYRTFGLGDFGTMSRSMSDYINLVDNIYNRALTRAYMESKGLNPYDYTGAERRALRQYLNGSDEGFNILKGSKLGEVLNLKFQQGGKMNEQQLQQAFIQYLAQKTGAKTLKELEAVIKQLGQEGLKKAYAEFIQLLQLQQVQAAKFGAKLEYIKTLRGQCPEGYDIQYYKAGGHLCKKCMKKHKNTPADPIDAFKCGRKMSKVKSNLNGDRVTLKREVKRGNTTTRYWSDGTTSKVLENGEAMPIFTGRDGKTYSSLVYPRNAMQRLEDAKADSLYNADWRRKTAPKLVRKNK